MIRTLMLTPLLAGAIAATATAKNNDSLKNEAAQAIRRGVRFLEARQDAATGAIGDLENPGITALSVLAILGDPAREPKLLPASAHKGYDFIATTKQPDGGLYVKGLANYNTSLCLTALMAHPTGDLRPLARAARAFVIGLQQDNGEPGALDQSHDGGIGYGGSSKYSDLSNTHFALEALYYAQALDAERPPAKDEPKLNYAAAIAFVSHCQNLKVKNDQPWVSEDPKNKGGFVYEPGVSKAGEEDLGDGKKALRSTGSISYAGLLSLIYAKLGPDDVRVKAVLEWLRNNFSPNRESRPRSAGALLLLPLDGQGSHRAQHRGVEDQGWQIDRLAHRDRKRTPPRSEAGRLMGQ